MIEEHQSYLTQHFTRHKVPTEQYRDIEIIKVRLTSDREYVPPRSGVSDGVGVTTTHRHLRGTVAQIWLETHACTGAVCAQGGACGVGEEVSVV